MNLFRKHKKFEEQINEQLGDMEVKPSSSLWDRIDSDLEEGPFENGMQNSLANFEQMPYPETWDKIASELPQEKTANGLTKYVVSAALALLFVAGLYTGKNWNPSPSGTIYSESRTQGEIPKGKTMEAAPVVTLSGSVQSRKRLNRERTGKTSVSDAVHKERSAGEPVKTIAKVQERKKGSPVNNIPEKEHNPDAEAIDGATVVEIYKEHPTAEQPQPIIIASEKMHTEQQDKVQLNLKSVTAEPPAAPVEQIERLSQVSEKETPSALQQPREMMSVHPDSIAVQPPAGLKAYKNDDALTSFSLSVYAGINICFTTYNDPKQVSGLNFDKNIALRKELERPTVDWSGGFLVDYRLGKKWMISSGVMMTNFNQKFDYRIESAKSPANANETGAPAVNPTDSFAVGNQYSNRIRFAWTEIPVFINYRISDGLRWNLDMQAGMSYGFLNTVDGGMISYDNKGVLVLKGKESFPNIQNALFVTAMPQVSYQFAPTISLGFAPTVKYSINSIIGNERWIQQHPYFIGATICLRKRF